MSNDPYAGPPPEPQYSSDPGYAPGAGYGPEPPFSEAAGKKLAAGICGVLLGAFGVHKFILGYNNTGIIMAVVTVGSIVGGIPTCGLTWPLTGVMGVIGLAEGIIYLTKSDEEFYHTYMVGKKEWF